MRNAILACFFIFTTLQAQAQVEIALRLDKGSTFCLNTLNKVTITETIHGAEQRMVNTEKGAFCYKVVEELDSLFLLETVFTHLSQQIESPGSIVNYSSDKPSQEDVISTLFSNVLNKPFLVWMRKDYTWKETKGLDSVFLNSYREYKLPPDTKRYLDSLILEMIKGFTRNDADLTAVLYNSKRMIPGEVWTTSTYSDNIIPMQDSCTYYLSETTGELLTLSGSGVVSSTGDKKRNGDELTSYEMKGNSEVSVTYFKNSFWIKTGTLTTKLKGLAMVRNVKTNAIRFVPTSISTEATINGYKLWGQENGGAKPRKSIPALIKSYPHFPTRYIL